MGPTKVSQFHRDQRYQILSANARGGIVLSRVFRGSTDATVFEDFMAQLLQHYGKWSEQKSAVVVDNASFHQNVLHRCVRTRGGKLVYLPPYSLDLTPIEFFAELKSFMKRNWSCYEADTDQGFDAFLAWCIDVVGAKRRECSRPFPTSRLKD